jgi:hypothetical protein
MNTLTVFVVCVFHNLMTAVVYSGWNRHNKAICRLSGNLHHLAVTCIPESKYRKKSTLHNIFVFFYDWLTVHHSITFLSPTWCTNFCLFTYNTLIKILYMFRAYPAHLQEVHFVIVYMRSLVLSLSAGDCPVHRLRKSFFLNRCTRQSPAESDDTRGCIYIQLRRRPPEDE